MDRIERLSKMLPEDIDAALITSDVNRQYYTGFVSSAGALEVCKDGLGLAFDEDLAKKILTEKEITIKITLKEGDCTSYAFGCDLTYDYVKINGDYRT